MSTETPSKELVRVNLACGQTKEPGWIGVDISPCEGVDIVHNLNEFPWPFESDSVDEAFVSHYIEHVPLDTPHGDGLICFMNELHRILKPGAKCTMVAPYYTSMRCWQDPTHRRAISEATFLYYNKAWRVGNKLDHYPITADFEFQFGYLMPQDLASRNDEFKTYAIRHYANAVNDIQVTLTKIK